MDRRHELKKTIQKYSEEGNYVSAIPYMEEYVDLIVEEFGAESDRYVTVINDLGGMYRNVGDFDNAEATFNKALDIIEAKLGKRSEQYATTTVNLACMYRFTNQFEKAEQGFLDALSIYDEDREMSEIIEGAACSFCAFKESLDGDAQKEKSKEAYRKKLLYANASNNLGTLYQDMKQFEKAVECHKKSLDILETTDKYDYIAITLSNLVNPLIQAKNFDEATALAKRSLEIFETHVSTDHPFYLMAYNNLGAIYFHTLEFEKALECFNVVEQKLKQTYGENSPQYKSALVNIESVKKYLDKSKKV